MARRRGYTWVVMAALVMGLGPGVGGLVALNAPGAVDSAVLGAGAALAALVTPTRRTARRRRPGHRRARPPVGRPTRPKASPWRRGAGRRKWAEVDHAAPNVGVVPSADGDRLYVTRGAIERLTRNELEAVCAAQMAIAHDAGVRRLAHAGSLLANLRFAVFLGIVPVVATALVGSLPTALLLVALLLPVASAAWLCGGRIAWWAAVATDAVCIRTTRHPQALATALTEHRNENWR